MNTTDNFPKAARGLYNCFGRVTSTFYWKPLKSCLSKCRKSSKICFLPEAFKIILQILLKTSQKLPEAQSLKTAHKSLKPPKNLLKLVEASIIILGVPETSKDYWKPSTDSIIILRVLKTFEYYEKKIQKLPKASKIILVVPETDKYYWRSLQGF